MLLQQRLERVGQGNIGFSLTLTAAGVACGEQRSQRTFTLDRIRPAHAKKLRGVAPVGGLMPIGTGHAAAADVEDVQALPKAFEDSAPVFE